MEDVILGDGDTAGGQRSHEGHEPANKGGPETSRRERLKVLLVWTCLMSLLAWAIQHASVWLHCLEELQGLVHVIHRGATTVPPSEGSRTTAGYTRPAAPICPSILRHEDKRMPKKRTKEESKQLSLSSSQWQQAPEWTHSSNSTG